MGEESHDFGGLTSHMLYDILWLQSEGKNLPEIFTEFNWIDVLFIILLTGMVYKGAKTGVSGQLLSFFGWVLILFVSIEYYCFLSEAIFGFLLQRWSKPISFLLISVIIFVSVKVLERVLNIISGDEVASIERVGGVLLAFVRAFILFGLIGIQLLLIPVDKVRLSATEGSKTCMFFVHMDVQIYSWIKGMIKLSSSDGDEREDNGKSVDTDSTIKQFMVATSVENPYR